MEFKRVQSERNKKMCYEMKAIIPKQCSYISNTTNTGSPEQPIKLS